MRTNPAVAAARRDKAARRGRRDTPIARRKRAHARAFTVVELLVVISIIGMLLSLLLPAVQASRECARANTCKNNLREIGLALLNHESALKRFPSGGWGFQWYGDPDRGSDLAQPGGWAFSVLPYIERRDLRSYGAGQSGQPKFQAIAQINETPISLFYCPTRRAPGTYPFDAQWPPRNAAGMSAVGKLDYAINGGDYQLKSGGGPDSYVEGDDPNYNWPDSSKGNGVCYFHATVSISQIRDGTSRTYLVGEKSVAPGGLDLGDDQGQFVGYDLDNTRWTTSGWVPVCDSGQPSHNRFGGAHQSACHFAFCDGSVHEVSYAVAPEVHRRLGNRQDGLIIEDGTW